MQKELFPTAGERILWVKFGGFGDILQALVSVQIFKKKFPDTHITFLTRAIYEETALSQPYIDDVIVGEKNSIHQYFTLIRALKKCQPFDWIVNYQGTGKTDTMGVLVNIPKKIYAEKMNFLRRPFYDYNYWDWADALGIDLRDREDARLVVPNQTVEKAKNLLSTLPTKKLFAIIGGAWKEKRWLTKYWCEFLKPLASKGWGIVLNGHGHEEYQIAQQIETFVNSSNLLNLVDKLSFIDMFGVVDVCSVALGNDTGALHLAALQGKPTLGIFGGTRYEPIDFLMPNFRAVHTTCINVGCGRDKLCKKICLESVTPQRVQSVFDQIVKTYDLD